MKIKWKGHACFTITLSDGRTIITDPFDPGVGYPMPQTAADIVTVSHQHSDHNAVKTVPGSPVIVQEKGEHNIGDIKIIGVPSYHDTAGGSQRGNNIIFTVEAEGIRVCHLGDLGHVPDRGQADGIGPVDVLLVPVGGFYTIGPDEAVKVVELIKPRYVLPMHYKTSYIGFPISTPEAFLANYPDYREERELVVDRDSLPGTIQVVLLELDK